MVGKEEKQEMVEKVVEVKMATKTKAAEDEVRERGHAHNLV